MANYLQEFGIYVRNLRMEKGFLSQRILAEKIGISNSTIAKIERGEHDASDETVYKLATAFGVNYMELLKKRNAGTKADAEMLVKKIKRLNKTQIDIITNTVDEFLRLGEK